MKDSFIVQITANFDGETDQDHAMEQVMQRLWSTEKAQDGWSFTGFSAWRCFERDPEHPISVVDDFEPVILMCSCAEWLDRDGICHNDNCDDIDHKVVS